MEKMKTHGKVLTVILMFIFVLVFVACGETSTPPPAGTTTSPPAATEEKPDTSGEVDKSDWIKLDLSYATYLPQTDAANMDYDFMQSSLKEAMGDEWVDITWYASSSLLGQTEMLEGIKAGTADIGFVDLTSYPEDFPASNLWAQPGLKVGSSPGGSAAFTEWALKNLGNYKEFDDIIFLNGQSNGPCTLLTTFPVTSVGDLKGHSLRCAAILSETVKTFGANPINMPTGEAYEALRSGLIDGQYASFGGMVSLGLGDYAKNATSFSMNTQVYAQVMNKELFNSMPESEQQAFLDGWAEFFYGKTLDHFEEKQILIVPSIIEGAQKVTWNFTDDTPLEQEFLSKGQPLMDAYKTKLEGMGYEPDAMLTEINSELDKWVEGWWDKAREMEVYIACSEGNYDEWLAAYTVPPNKPDHVKMTPESYK